MTIRARRGFTLIELMVVIVIIGLLLALLLPAISKAMCTAKLNTTKALLSQLTEAAKAYQLDCNEYPPNDASFQSSFLVKALRGQQGSKKQPYFEFQKEQLDEQENILNPVLPTESIKYRRNEPDYPTNLNDASVHNKTGIDLWGTDCAKVKDGLNNWSD